MNDATAHPVHHRKAIVISPFWAGIIATLIGGGMLTLGSVAANAYAQMAVLSSDVSDLKGAKLDARLNRIEEKLDWIIKKGGR